MLTETQLVDTLSNILQMVVMGYFIGSFIQVSHRSRFLILFTTAMTALNAAFYFNRTIQVIVIWTAVFVLPLVFGRISKIKIILYLLLSLLLMNVFSLPGNLVLIRLYPDAIVSTDYPIPAILAAKLLTFPLLVLSWYISGWLGGKILHVEQEHTLRPYLPFLLVETVAIVLEQLIDILPDPGQTLLVSCSIGVFAAMLIINLLLVRTVSQLNQAHSTELQLQQAEALLRSQSESYEMFQSQLLSLHRIRHDTANQLSTISYLLETGNYAGAQRQLSAFQRTSAELASGHYTGNTTIDAVINVKLTGLEPGHIRFQSEGTLPMTLPLDSAALCSVMSNLLDNAVHACEALPAQQSAVISLKSGIRQNYLILRCTNPCTPDTALPEPDSVRPAPTDNHGWGLQILRQIAAQHNGSADFRLENGWFIAEIQLGLGNAPRKTATGNTMSP